jgi:hypothetical protein
MPPAPEARGAVIPPRSATIARAPRPPVLPSPRGSCGLAHEAPGSGPCAGDDPAGRRCDPRRGPRRVRRPVEPIAPCRASLAGRPRRCADGRRRGRLVYWIWWGSAELVLRSIGEPRRAPSPLTGGRGARMQLMGKSTGLRPDSPMASETLSRRGASDGKLDPQGKRAGRRRRKLVLRSIGDGSTHRTALGSGCPPALPPPHRLLTRRRRRAGGTPHGPLRSGRRASAVALTRRRRGCASAPARHRTGPDNGLA